MRRPALCLGFLMAVWPTASADTQVVHPDGTGDFPTIQAAVDGVKDGDTIVLMNGVFQGDGNRDIWIHDRDIAIRSQWLDPTRCTVDCGGGGGSVCGFSFYGDGQSTLDGVTITNATHSGIRIEGGARLISRCILRANSSNQGGGIYVDFWCDPLITHCTFVENQAAAGGGMCI